MVDGINAQTYASQNTASSKGQETASSFASGDFQTFLTMLTAQIKNQDPMNPMDSTDFAVQLATFSGVEQQVRTNQLLASLIENNSMSDLSQYANWIGKEVMTSAPVHFDTGAVPIYVTPASSADSATLVATDVHGREVSRQTIPLAVGDVEWSGRDANGAALPSGLYAFKVESYAGGTLISTAQAGAYSTVTGAEMTSEGVRLTLLGGANSYPDEIVSIRQPN